MKQPQSIEIKTPESAFSLFNKSVDVIKANAKTFGILYIVPLFFTLMSRANEFRISNNRTLPVFKGINLAESPFLVMALIGGGILFVGLYFYIAVCLLVLEVDAANGKQPSLKQVIAKAGEFWPRILGLIVVTALLVIGGLFLFIVPGLILFRRYLLSPYVLIDQDLSIGEAMRRSAELSRQHSIAIWSLIGVSLLISLTTFLPGIGWIISLVLGFLYSVAPALRYFELKRLSSKKI